MEAATARGGVVTPPRSLVQRLDALRRANEIRTARARTKREMKVGEVSALALLTDVPPHLRTMKVIDFLLAVPKVGPVKSKSLVRWVGVAPSKTLGGMSERQRGELKAHLSR